MFKVFLSAQAQKDSKKIPLKDKQKIHKKLTTLETNPYLGKKLTGKLSGYFSIETFFCFQFIQERIFTAIINFLFISALTMKKMNNPDFFIFFN